MRDIVIGLAIVAVCILALRRPWLGALGWAWVSLMNPHALSWKLNTMPVAAAIAGCTLAGLALTRQQKNFTQSTPSIILIIFMFWICITLPFSFNIDSSYEMWKRVMKIDFMILVTLALIHSKRQLVLFTWVVAASIAFYGVKGGIFTLLTGGSFRVWGPTSTFIEGNNEVALALIMVIPLLRFLQLQLASKWARHLISLSMLLCAASALGSHSRGALLAIVAMGIALWWYGGRKIGVFFSIALIAIAALFFMPEQWFARMGTISEYNQDASAMGRINAWWMAWNLALDNFFGGGFSIYQPSVFALYAPDPTDIHAAHSIYFQVLGEHGFVGLFLFMLLWWSVWRQAGALRISGKGKPETEWISQLGAMCQVCIMGYAVGGAFLSLSYFDLPYNILVIVIVARRWLDKGRLFEEDKAVQKPLHTEMLKAGAHS